MGGRLYGATADHIPLSDGDYVDVSMFSGSRSSGDFLYFTTTDNARTPVHVLANQVEGVPFDVKVRRPNQNMWQPDAFQTYSDVTGVDVEWGTTLGEALGSATVDDEGVASVAIDQPGTYYLWAYSDSTQALPAYATVTVGEPAAGAPTFSQTSLPSATTGEEYSAKVETTSDPAADVTYTLVPGNTLPEDLSLAADGTISGTPTADTGDYSFTVTCDNGVGAAATKEITLKVVPKYKEVTGTAYITMSNDGLLMTSDGEQAGVTMSCVPIDLAEVSKVDLDDVNIRGANLGGFKYDADGDGTYEVTMLQLFVYLADHYYSGGSASMQTWGTGGSFFLASYFGLDYNLNYYRNYEYPRAREGWGSTLDQIPIADGDHFDFVHWTSMYGGYGYSPFQWFTVANGDPANADVTYEYHGVAGQPVTVQMKQVVLDYSAYSTTYTASKGIHLHAGTEYSTADAFAGDLVTDENGQAQVTSDKPGTYYVWADGVKNSTDWAGDFITNCAAMAKVVVDGTPEADTATLPAAIAGEAYSAQLSAMGGAPYTWYLDPASKLPEGLSLASDGTISGTTTDVGTHTFDVAVQNQYGISQAATVTLVVNGTTPTITTESVPAATVGQPYSAMIEAAGYPTPRVVLVRGSELPEGLSFADNGDGTATISGTPTRAGDFSLTVRPMNGASSASNRELTLTVAEPADRSALDAAIAQAQAIGRGGKAAGAFAALQAAIASAQAVSADGAASQADVDAAASALAGAVSAFQASPAASRVGRLSGDPADGAAGTAAAIAAEAFGDEKADTVVIARDDDYHDALAGSGLAGALGAPVLLTDSGSLSQAAADEAGALGATRAVILGGESALAFVSGHASEIQKAHVLGGEAASTPALYDAIRSALGEGGDAE